MANTTGPTANTYTAVARAWGTIFILVALLFLLLPEVIGSSLTDLAHILGLSGEIRTGTSTLWHVLTLSLMGTISLLAFKSSKYPSNIILYNALVLAKTISVIGFLVLSYKIGAAWLVCAGGDAFVALTLVLTYAKPETTNMAPGFASVEAQGPSYEIWYGKIDISPGKAFWFRYTTIDGVRQEASTWAINFSNAITTGKTTSPLSDLAPPNRVILPETLRPKRFQNNPQVYHLGCSHLDGSNAIGVADTISWDLTFTDSGRGFEHVPPLVKALKVAKSNYYACFLDLRFSGTINCGDETININDRPGMIGHINGKQSAHSWAWAHCNNFDGAENVVFEGLSARIELGGKPSKPLSSFILITEDNRYEFSTTKSLLKSPSEFENGEWTFESKSNTAIIKGKAIAPKEIALVEYTDTDDSNLWCYNSKLASLEIELKDLKSGKTYTYRTENSAAFELVNRETPQLKVDL